MVKRRGVRRGEEKGRSGGGDEEEEEDNEGVEVEEE